MHGTMKFILTYSISLAALLIIDFIWLGGIAKNIYQTKLSHFLQVHDGALSIRIAPALLLYVIMMAGSFYFVVLPRVQEPLWSVCLAGFLFGFVIYSVYDLTNYSIMQEWPLSITLIDSLWGASLNAIVAAIAWSLYKLF